MTSEGVSAARFDDIRAHLASEYRDVFPPDQVRRHIAEYVALDPARPLVDLVQHRCSSSSRLVDVGCGFGSFVIVARERGFDAMGIDSASFEIRVARDRLAALEQEADPDAVFRRGDALSLPLEASSADVVTVWNVIEHVRDYRLLLREIERVLRPGGWLFVIAPNYASFRREAHYLVPWFPLLPRRLASAYLSALGRDPTFFEQSVFYCTMTGVRTELKRLGFELTTRRQERLAKPEMMRHAAPRRIVEAMHGIGLGWIPAGVARVLDANPIRRVIAIEARTAGP